jgi:hypothetical protein
VIKKVLSDIAGSFSQRADRVADCLLNDEQGYSGAKTKRIKGEIFLMVRDIVSGIKRDSQNLKTKDIACLVSYKVGRISGIALDTCARIFKD